MFLLFIFTCFTYKYSACFPEPKTTMLDFAGAGQRVKIVIDASAVLEYSDGDSSKATRVYVESGLLTGTQ